MKITKISGIEPETLILSLKNTFSDSRFSLEIAPIKGGINLGKVRLKQSKDYCGNHAKACERPAKKDKKATFLEGADWVEFNDTLNNLLDCLMVSATIESSACQVRKGNSRRIRYDADTFIGVPNNGEWRWNKTAPDSHWQNRLGMAASYSQFPKGTPGIHNGVGYNVKG